MGVSEEIGKESLLKSIYETDQLTKVIKLCRLVLTFVGNSGLSNIASYRSCNSKSNYLANCAAGG
jgi:hypothetical protein